MGATPFPLHFQEYPEGRGAEAELEGAEKAEVSELLSEEELGEVVGWSESAAVLEIAGMAPE